MVYGPRDDWVIRVIAESSAYPRPFENEAPIRLKIVAPVDDTFRLHRFV